MKKLLQIKSFLCTLLLMQMFTVLQAQNPVGAIPGVIDVSPMGAASYTIPIEVVPGTQGMQPNLSIVYNSFGGMGLLGMKWNLAGLSAITRCGKTPYYDDNITAIQFNNQDKFALDGNRLLQISSGNYGGNGVEYATEMENFTRVVSHRYLNNSQAQPDHFTVYTDDGSIIEYGNTDDSKQKLGAYNISILGWCINKITDANGNYMTFEYKRYFNEIVIAQIQYTGNDFQPYAKVKFDYGNLPNLLGKNNYFVHGCVIPQTKLLETITVYHDNTTVRKYKFIYNTEDSGERTAHLKEIVLSDGNENELNATTIEWGDNHLSININDNIGVRAGKFLTGDFNGDGYTDILKYNEDKGYNLYLFNPATNSYPQTPTISAPNYMYAPDMLYAQDINGDGKDELITGKKMNSSEYQFTFYSMDNETMINVGGRYIYDFYNIYFGDFDGDGVTDVVFASVYGIGKTFYWTLTFLLSGSNNLKYINFEGKSLQARDINVQIVDINGNGKNNILVKFLNKTSIYEFNGSSFTPLFSNVTTIAPYNHPFGYVFYGDLNGDGITDAVAWTSTSELVNKWTVYTGDGNGYYIESEMNNGLSHFYSGHTSSLERNEVMFVDLNGDGKEDIIQGSYNPLTDRTTFFILLSRGYVNGEYKFTRKTITVQGKYHFRKDWHVGDFKGNGRMGILLIEFDNPTGAIPKILFIDQDANYEFVQKIVDGIDKTIKLNYNYKYFIAQSKHYKNISPYYFLSERKYFLPVVESIQASNGIGTGLNTMQYQYNMPVYSLTKKTFLGFNEFVCINNEENKRDELIFNFQNHRLNTTKYIRKKQLLLPAFQIRYSGNQKTSEKAFNIELKDIANDPANRFVMNYETTEACDFLSNTKVVTTHTLNSAGRVATSNAKTYDGCTNSNWMHSESKTYTYETIILDEKQKKTVPTKVLTTQQYGSSGVMIADTLTYGYYPASNKGRPEWMRRGNIHGVITTKYENYTPAGLYGKKTVIAGSDSRSETYNYDATQRFVIKITNPLTHAASFTYDAKTGNKLTETDINGLITTFQYETFGNLTQINYPDGAKTNISVKKHTASNPPNAKYYTATTSSGKPDVTVYYDVLGREVCRKDDDYYYQTVYNNKGQIEKTSGPFANFALPEEIIWHNYTYDNYGRKLTEKKPYADLEYSCPFGSRKLTVTDKLCNNIQSWKDYDALGRMIEAKDEGGTVTYSYTVTSGKRDSVTIKHNDTVITAISSDLWGNRRFIKEANAGLITSAYNGFNELVTQIDALGNSTHYQYDKLGRITQKQFTATGEAPMTIKYTYDNYSTYNRGRGKVYKILVNNEVEETYRYDAQSRLEQYDKVIDDRSYTFFYYYTQTGQLGYLTYPDGFTVNYSYSSTGKLREIRSLGYYWFDEGLIYKVHSRNQYNAPTRCEYGNGVITDYTYNSYGMLTRIKTGNRIAGFSQDPGGGDAREDIFDPNQLACTVDSAILNYRYAYNDRGLMSSRSESVMNRLETYTYDSLDRLTRVKSGVIGQAGTPQTFSYRQNGNISNHSGVGLYIYNSGKPHAVGEIEPINQNVISAHPCAVDYNFFNQPTQITEGACQINLFYGSNQQRNKMVVFNSGGNSLNSTRYYINKYYEMEDVVFRPQFSREYRYIYGDNGVVALKVYEGGHGTDSTYYIHTDHLGSYCAITNEGKNVVRRNYFDPWGNFTVNNIVYYSPDFSITDRGFTGHEHYPEFKIINMNGRLYDPVIARFFSPDKYVANSSFTQDFNRYSYARNCPLAYVDPNGEFIVAAIIGAFVCAAINLAVNADHITKGWQFFAYAGVGAASGFAGGAAGGAAAGAIGVTGFIGGMGAGAAGGLAGGFINGAGNTWIQGGSFGQGLLNGLISGGISAGIGGLTGGFIGGIEAAAHGANFWNGHFTHYSTLPGESGISWEQAQSNAKAYNSSMQAQSNDVYLADRAYAEMNFKVGDLDVGTLTTRTPYGLNENMKYVMNAKGDLAAGYAEGILGKPPYSIHISPQFSNGNIVDFKAVMGHEMIHAFHYTAFGLSYNRSYSEAVAYKYSYNTLMAAGNSSSAFQINTVGKYGWYPPAYRIPFGLKWPIY